MNSIITLLTPKKQTFFLRNDATLRQALEKFDAHKFTVVPLIDKSGKYITTISQGDLLSYFKEKEYFDIKELENVRLMDISHYRPYRALKIDALYIEVFSLLLEQNFIPVTDDNGIYIGIIKRREAIKQLSAKLEDKLLLEKE